MHVWLLTLACVLNTGLLVYLMRRRRTVVRELHVKDHLVVEGYLDERPGNPHVRGLDGDPSGVGSLLLVGNPQMNVGLGMVKGRGDDKRAGWLGADGNGSMRMSDGRYLWLFGDTFFGTQEQRGLFWARRDPQTVHTPHNSFGIMEMGDWDGLTIPSSMTFHAGARRQDQRYPAKDAYVHSDDAEDCHSWITPADAAEGMHYWPKAGSDMMDGSGGVLLFCLVNGDAGLERCELLHIPQACESDPRSWDVRAERIALPRCMQRRVDAGGLQIAWTRVTPLQGGEVLVQGWEQVIGAARLFMARGRPADFVHAQDRIQLWATAPDQPEPAWRGATDELQLAAVELKVGDDGGSVFSGSGTSEVYRVGDRYALVTMVGFSNALFDSDASSKGWALDRFVTDPGAGPEGPYRRGAKHVYRFPEWTREQQRWSIYAVRTHPELMQALRLPREDLQEQGYELEMVLSWIAQPWFPYYSSDMFEPRYAYQVYQPQLVFLWSRPGESD